MRFDVAGSGPPVLLVHGIPAARRLWDLVTDHLAGRFTLVAPDLPGFGKSPPLPDHSRDPARFAAALEELRRRLGYPRWDVVGHDAGATVAAHYAATYGDGTRRLCLMAPPVFPEFRPPWFFRLLRRRGVGELVAPLVIFAIWNGGIQSIVDRRDPRMDAILASFRAPFRGLAGARRLISLVRWGEPREVLGRTAACLPAIRAPALILHGRDDGAIPESFARRAAELIPDARLEVLDTGHFLPLNRPAEVAELLGRFLAEAAVGAAG